MLALLVLLPARGHIEAQEGPSLSLEPATLTVAPEDGPFEVRLMVDDVTTDQGLGGYTLVMDYDPSVLHALTITNSGFLESTENPVVCPATATDNDAGRLAHFCLTVPIIPGPGPETSEPQVLARVTFEPVGDGTTTLDISDTAILNPDGNSLEATTTNGEVTVGSGSPVQPAQTPADLATASDDGQNVGLYVGLGVAALVVAGLVGAALALRRRIRRDADP